MATDIFIVTHAPDVTWLKYCLRSVEKFARQFRRTLVLYPEKEEATLGPVCREHPGVKPIGVQQPFDGHLVQNALKTAPDTYSDADYFFHLDSDCVLTAETTPLTHTTNGRPDLWYRFYEELRSPEYGGTGVPWQAITEHALGRSVEVETMCRFPFLFPRFLYHEVRKRIEYVHGVSFLEYVRTAPKLGYAFHGYCEFNALGSWAYYEYPHLFHLRHVFAQAGRPSNVKQYWSHMLRERRREFDTVVLPELERITAGYREAK